MIIASFLGFDNNEAAALAIIGGADGPTAIYTSIILAPHLLGPIAIAAYSYMALVPVIIPAVVRLLVSKKELLINMKKQDESSNNPDIKNLDIIKIIFPYPCYYYCINNSSFFNHINWFLNVWKLTERNRILYNQIIKVCFRQYFKF